MNAAQSRVECEATSHFFTSSSNNLKKIRPAKGDFFGKNARVTRISRWILAPRAGLAKDFRARHAQKGSTVRRPGTLDAGHIPVYLWALPSWQRSSLNGQRDQKAAQKDAQAQEAKASQALTSQEALGSTRRRFDRPGLQPAPCAPPRPWAQEAQEAPGRPSGPYLLRSPAARRQRQNRQTGSPPQRSATSFGRARAWQATRKPRGFCTGCWQTA